MRRRSLWFALLFGLSTLIIAPSAASAYDQYPAWRPSDSNKLKSYTFNTSPGLCPHSYRLRIEFELGAVTATTAYIKNIRFYWSNIVNLFAISQATSFTPVSDSYGHASYGDDPFVHPRDGSVWTFAVSKQFKMTTDQAIVLERTDNYAGPNCSGLHEFKVNAHAP